MLLQPPIPTTGLACRQFKKTKNKSILSSSLDNVVSFQTLLIFPSRAFKRCNWNTRRKEFPCNEYYWLIEIWQTNCFDRHRFFTRQRFSYLFSRSKWLYLQSWIFLTAHLHDVFYKQILVKKLQVMFLQWLVLWFLWNVKSETKTSNGH